MLNPLRRKSDDEIKKEIKLGYYSFLLYYVIGLTVLFLGYFTLYTHLLILGALLLFLSGLLVTGVEHDKIVLEIRQGGKPRW